MPVIPASPIAQPGLLSSGAGQQNLASSSAPKPGLSTMLMAAAEQHKLGRLFDPQPSAPKGPKQKLPAPQSRKKLKVVK